MESLSPKEEEIRKGNESHKESPWLVQVPVEEMKHGGNGRDLQEDS